MSIPETNDLFHDSGAQGILDFLLSKLEVNDLSPEEALALLSAVHEELGEQSGTQPKVYQSYTNLMKLLQREKPEIYDYIVLTWNRSNKAESTEADNRDINIGEFDTGVSKTQGIEEKVNKGFDEVKKEDGESDDEGESQEPGETEEKESTEVEKTDDVADEGKNEESAEAIGEVEGSDKEGNGDGQEELTDDNENDLVDEPDNDEAQEDGNEKVEEEAESGEEISEADEEAELSEVSDASPTGLEKGEPAGEAGGEQGETEWPDVEESISEEPLDGLESEDGPSAAVD